MVQQMENGINYMEHRLSRTLKLIRRLTLSHSIKCWDLGLRLRTLGCSTLVARDGHCHYVSVDVHYCGNWDYPDYMRKMNINLVVVPVLG